MSFHLYITPNVDHKFSKILVEENIFSHSEFTTLSRIELNKILLFGHPELSKNPSSRLFKADVSVFV